MDINFNGFTLGQLFTIEDVRITTLPDVEVSSKKVPSRHGTIFQGATIGERTVEVDIALVQDYITQFTDAGVPVASVYNNYIRSIIYYCQTDEPCKLVVSDEPDRYLWAICTGIETERLYNVGKGTITFLCNDPYYYETTYNAFLPDSNNKFKIDNLGTVPAYPTVKVTAESDMTYLAVVSPESVVQVGKLMDDDNSSNKTYKYKDSIKTTNNWYYGSQALCPSDCQYDPDITYTGTGEVLRPALTQYEENPTSPYNYKGTCVVTNLNSNYQSKYFDTRLQFWFSSRSSYGADATSRVPSQKGAISIALLDINNNVIARCGMYDNSKVVEKNVPYVKLGATTNVWIDEAQTPSPTVKRYKKVFESEDELPHDATLVDTYERKKGGQETAHIDVNSCPVFSGSEVTYKYVTERYTVIENGKEVTKTRKVKVFKTKATLKMGSKYRVKSKKSGWVCIWLNSKRTSSGWVQAKNVTVTKTEEETEQVYVYERKIYPAKNIGKYCDFWGYFKIKRQKHSNGKGDIWTISLYRLNENTSKATKLMSKKITDSTGTKYTNAGKIAKVAVFMGSRDTSAPVARVSYNHLEVTAYADDYEDEPEVFASAGDTIEIDYSVPDVTLNGESILEHVDIGSRFNPLQPFMQTEMEIVSDGFFDSEIDLRNRYL